MPSVVAGGSAPCHLHPEPQQLEHSLPGTLPIIRAEGEIGVWGDPPSLSELLPRSDHIASAHASLAMCEPHDHRPLITEPQTRQMGSSRAGITGKATGCVPLRQSLSCHVIPQ